MTEAPSPFILCSTARLARSLRANHAKTWQQAGLTQWQPPQIVTCSQWLASVTEQVLLGGHVAPHEIPRQVVGGMTERLLWEEVISQSTVGRHALFDVSGMAQSAMEANALMQAWGVFLPESLQTDETRQFLRWRAAFRELCGKHDVLEESRLLERQIGWLKHVDLPDSITLAGFDRISPLEQKLFDTLAGRCRVEHWQSSLEKPAEVIKADFDEAGAECRAAVDWVREKLQLNPQARLAIVVPELAALRAALQHLLDDALHPAAIHPAHAETPRVYDFSLGQPLTEIPVIATALALLRLAFNHRFSQQETGALLRDVYWSLGVSEADARARLEADMRRKLPATISLDQFIRMARKAPQYFPSPLMGEGAKNGLIKLVAHLEAMQQKIVTTRNPPSGWVRVFAGLLEAAHWPGERSLSSFEFQARQAWLDSLQEFAELDALLGKMTGSEALRQLSRLLRERIFQPESDNTPQVQVMGMLEAVSEPLDALWVMGMNDHIWPPPARPNPLLPAESQRKCGAPNSCSAVQAEFAATVHQRLLKSAPEIVFSWARKAGERELRPSPVLKDIACSAQSFPLAQTLAGQLAQPQAMEWVDDHKAPPVAEGEKVRGGAQLFEHQAICPAWGYYQHRLGARALEEPVDGLDSRARGSLLHAVLQAFWHGHDSAYLVAMDEAAQAKAVEAAVEQGWVQFVQALDEPLPAAFVVLEKLRLVALLNGWLEIERERPPFTVQDCERRVKLDIKGISVEFTLDRIDVLEDARLVVIDYKTGSQLSANSWAAARITEPQLPIYAALVLAGDQVAAVCFARVRAGEHGFIGITEESNTLPGVKGLEDARKVFDEVRFPDWASVIAHWRGSLELIAEEIKAGEAAVCFDNENDLAYCDVKPLLRLPERKLQMERGGK